MRSGVREFRDASLTVSVPTTIPEHMRAGTREISHVFVKAGSRGQRLATALMNFICQEADANRMTLILVAREYDEGGPDEAKLITWYEKFGFKKLDDTPTGTFMARQVREKSRLHLIKHGVSKALH